MLSRFKVGNKTKPSAALHLRSRKNEVFLVILLSNSSSHLQVFRAIIGSTNGYVVVLHPVGCLSCETKSNPSRGSNFDNKMESVHGTVEHPRHVIFATVEGNEVRNGCWCRRGWWRND